jgi:hypothetical protein
MLNIFSYWGNGNQNHVVSNSSPSELLLSIYLSIPNFARDMRGKEPFPYALLVGTKISAATGEISIKIPQKTKIELPYDPTILLLHIYPKETKSAYIKKPPIPSYLYYGTIHNSKL